MLPHTNLLMCLLQLIQYTAQKPVGCMYNLNFSWAEGIVAFINYNVNIRLWYCLEASAEAKTLLIKSTGTLLLLGSWVIRLVTLKCVDFYNQNTWSYAHSQTVLWRSMGRCHWDYSSYLSPSQDRRGRNSIHPAPFWSGFMEDGVAMRHAMTNEVMRGKIEEKISSTGSGPASSDGFHKSLLWPFPSRQGSIQTGERCQHSLFSVVNATVVGIRDRE